MDFKLSEEEEKRRKEFFDVCKELEKEKPASMIMLGLVEWETEEEGAFDKRCRQEFAKRGWLRLAWPTEYGGTGTMMDRVFFGEATGYYGIPGVDIFGIGLLAPTLIHLASKEMKDRFLPPIGNGDMLWCQLWSEPNAGSDLANASTTAIRKGDEYIINGQKTWTSFAHFADWGFGLFKSDLQARKHHNLSFILVDMKTPGITIRPLYYFNGRHIYNEVFLDDVHVPVENRIGEEGQGWQVTQIMAGFERSGAGTIMVGKRMVDDLVKYCNETKVEGKLLAHDSVIRNRLAEAACEVEAARTLAYYVADQQRRPGGLGLFEASSVKIFSTELTERIAALGADILGTYGQVKTSKWAPQSGFWEDEYQWCLALEIAAGTNEIQRNIIAWMGLGMPRPPRPIPKA